MSERQSPVIWRNKKEMYCLAGEVCLHCDNKIFPPKDICPGCGDEEMEPFTFSGKGEVYSFTTIYEAPSGHVEQAPYTIAIIKLDEGPMLTAQITDNDPHEPIQIGLPVEMVTRIVKRNGETGVIEYGYKFRPRLDTC